MLILSRNAAGRHAACGLRALQSRWQIERDKSEEERRVLMSPVPGDRPARERLSVLAAHNESISGTVYGLTTEFLEHTPQKRAIIRRQKSSNGLAGEVRLAPTELCGPASDTYDVETFAEEENDIEGCENIRQ